MLVIDVFLFLLEEKMGFTVFLNMLNVILFLLKILKIVPC